MRIVQTLACRLRPKNKKHHLDLQRVSFAYTRTRAVHNRCVCRSFSFDHSGITFPAPRFLDRPSTVLRLTVRDVCFLINPPHHTTTNLQFAVVVETPRRAALRVDT
jgi:hypothetical protein